MTHVSALNCFAACVDTGSENRAGQGRGRRSSEQGFERGILSLLKMCIYGAPVLSEDGNLEVHQHSFMLRTCQNFESLAPNSGFSGTAVLADAPYMSRSDQRNRDVRTSSEPKPHLQHGAQV